MTTQTTKATRQSAAASPAAPPRGCLQSTVATGRPFCISGFFTISLGGSYHRYWNQQGCSPAQITMGYLLKGFSKKSPIYDERENLFRKMSQGKKDKKVGNMGVSKNRGIPKWTVYIGNTLLKWMIWGENPLFFGNTHIGISGTYRKKPPTCPLADAQILAGSNLEQLRQGEVPLNNGQTKIMAL